MKIVVSVNHIKPELSGYMDAQIVHIFKNDAGYTFALHKSHNALISCYMVSEYTTGLPLKAFPVPRIAMAKEDVDNAVTKAQAYVDRLSENELKEVMRKFKQVNRVEDDIDEFPSEPDYQDVRDQTVAKEKQKIIDQKLAKAKEKPATPTAKPKPKRKRGRPKKKVDGGPSTLI